MSFPKQELSNPPTQSACELPCCSSLFLGILHYPFWLKPFGPRPLVIIQYMLNAPTRAVPCLAVDMIAPQFIAVLHTKCGEMHFYDFKAIQMVLSALPCASVNALASSLLANIAPSLHEGFTV